MNSCVLLFALAMLLQVASANVIVMPRLRQTAAQKAQAPTGLRTPAQYDCDVFFLDSVTEWPQDRREYCCQKHRLLCDTRREAQAEMVVNGGYDCDEGLENWQQEWLVGKKVWCCAKERKGCLAAHKYDCDADFMDWRSSWSIGKKSFCCEHEGRGCQNSAAEIVELSDTHRFNCQVARNTWEMDWSDAKKAWCRSSMALPTYDCDVDFVDWRSSWSVGKMALCCEQEGRGCQNSAADVVEPSDTHHFNCQTARDTWEMDWSDAKKAWCQSSMIVGV